MDLFHKLNEEQHKTIVLITHSPELAEETDRIISIRDGYIVSEVVNRDVDAKGEKNTPAVEGEVL